MVGFNQKGKSGKQEMTIAISKKNSRFPVDEIIIVKVQIPK